MMRKNICLVQIVKCVTILSECFKTNLIDTKMDFQHIHIIYEVRGVGGFLRTHSYILAFGSFFLPPSINVEPQIE